jgi:hypothetical protein
VSKLASIRVSLDPTSRLLTSPICHRRLPDPILSSSGNVFRAVIPRALRTRNSAGLEGLSGHKGTLALPDLSLDLRYLRYVFAVVEQGSFRQAASKLDVPHGVDASRVDSWEIDLGTAINF